MNSPLPTAIADDSAFDELCWAVAADPASYIKALPFLQAARRSIRSWAIADRDGWKLEDRRLRRIRFFIFVCQAYEASRGCRAGITWNRVNESSPVGGDFFEFAKRLHDLLLPPDLRSANDVALAKSIERTLSRRTADPLPKNKAGRKRLAR